MDYLAAIILLVVIAGFPAFIMIVIRAMEWLEERRQIKQGLADMKAGRVRPAEEIRRELRERNDSQAEN